MADWLITKAAIHEHKRAAAKRKKDKYTFTGKRQLAHHCKICGQEIRAGSLCASCAEFIRSKKNAE